MILGKAEIFEGHLMATIFLAITKRAMLLSRGRIFKGGIKR